MMNHVSMRIARCRGAIKRRRRPSRAALLNRMIGASIASVAEPEVCRSRPITDLRASAPVSLRKPSSLQTQRTVSCFRVANRRAAMHLPRKGLSVSGSEGPWSDAPSDFPASQTAYGDQLERSSKGVKPNWRYSKCKRFCPLCQFWSQR